MCLGFDHRATDGAQAGKFVATSSAGWRLSTRRPPSGSGTPSGDEHMRVVVTGGAGFIGRAVVKRLADRGDEVVALVRDPAKAHYLERDARHARRQRPARACRHDRPDEGRRRASSMPPAISWSASRNPSSRRCGTPTSARPSAFSMPPLPPACHASSTSRPSTSSVTRTAKARRRNLSARPGRGLPVLLRRGQYRAHEAAEKRIAAGAPIVIVHAVAGLRPERPLVAERPDSRRPTRASCVTSSWAMPRTPGFTSTTWPPASSPPSTAVASASRTYSPAKTSAYATLLPSRHVLAVDGHRASSYQRHYYD